MRVVQHRKAVQAGGVIRVVLANKQLANVRGSLSQRNRFGELALLIELRYLFVEFLCFRSLVHLRAYWQNINQQNNDDEKTKMPTKNTLFPSGAFGM